MSAPGTLRRAAKAALALGFATLLGACDLILEIGHGDRFLDPHLDCSGGTCVCTGGFEDCDLDGDTGCESEIAFDPMNCGACGNICANGICNDGACTCEGGFVDCDGLPSNGCEADLQTDTKNCGACGHDCQGTCQDGVCLPVTLTGLDDAVSLAVYAETVFIARCGDPSVGKLSTEAGATTPPYSATFFTGCASLVAAGNGHVYFAAGKQLFSAPFDPLDPSANPMPDELLPGSDVFPARLFGVSDEHLYFWNNDTAQLTQALARVPIGGGAIQVAADALVTALAVDAGGAYWADQGGLHAWATSEDQPTVIAAGLQTVALAVQGDTLFLADAKGISSLSVTGGTPSPVIAAKSVKAIAAGETHVYWADGGDGSVRRVGRDGNDETVLATGESFADETPLVIDDEAIYWISGATSTRVRRVAR